MGQRGLPCYPSTELNLLDVNQKRDKREMLLHPMAARKGHPHSLAVDLWRNQVGSLLNFLISW